MPEDGLQAGHLDAEPTIFRGCTYTELGVIVALSLLFWLPASLTFAGLLGRLSMGLGAATFGVIGTVVYTAGLFQKVKRGRPEGYYQARVAVWLHDLGLRDSGYIRRTGAWDIGRRRRL